MMPRYLHAHQPVDLVCCGRGTVVSSRSYDVYNVILVFVAAGFFLYVLNLMPILANSNASSGTNCILPSQKFI